MQNILIIEDDPDLNQTIGYALENGDDICPGKDLSGAAGCESAGWRGLHVLPLGKGAERGAGDLSDGKGSGGGCAGGI